MKALLLVVPMFAAASVSAGHCSKWMTYEFWGDAIGETVRGCLAQGADLKARDRDGWTPLHYAARCGRADAVLALLKAGAGPNVRSENGYTPLHFADRYGHADAVLALLKGGADPALGLDPEGLRYYSSHDPCDADPNDVSRRRPHHPQTTTPRYYSIEP